MCQKLVSPLLDIQDTCTAANQAVIFPSNLQIGEVELDGQRFSLVCCAENIRSLVSCISRRWGKKEQQLQCQPVQSITATGQS